MLIKVFLHSVRSVVLCLCLKAGKISYGTIRMLWITTRLALILEPAGWDGYAFFDFGVTLQIALTTDLLS